jgi:hypothetical protein
VLPVDIRSDRDTRSTRPPSNRRNGRTPAAPYAQLYGGSDHISAEAPAAIAELVLHIIARTD